MKIITLTINPALDKSAKVDSLVPDNKLKCHSIRYQPGGGGINISRVLKRLGVDTNCIFPCGGNTGSYLKELLLAENIHPSIIPTKGWTRENLSIVDTQTGLQYRLGMPGNILAETELLALENTLKQEFDKNDMVVFSGSLAEGLSTNYYSKLIQILSNKKVKIIIDTSGAAFKEALKQNVYLIKPNQRELAQLAEKEYLSTLEQEAFAMELVRSKKVKYVVVSLGARGAFMASDAGIQYQSTPSVLVKSSIGAGDSMVAGLIYAIVKEASPEAMLKWGVACGVAATMSEGTNLAQKENIDQVLRMIKG